METFHLKMISIESISTNMIEDNLKSIKCKWDTRIDI